MMARSMAHSSRLMLMGIMAHHHHHRSRRVRALEGTIPSAALASEAEAAEAEAAEAAMGVHRTTSVNTPAFRHRRVPEGITSRSSDWWASKRVTWTSSDPPISVTGDPPRAVILVAMPMPVHPTAAAPMAIMRKPYSGGTVKCSRSNGACYPTSASWRRPYGLRTPSSTGLRWRSPSSRRACVVGANSSDDCTE